MANDTAVPGNRTERTLAYMIASVAGLSILAIVGVVVGQLAGADLSAGVWPAVTVLPLIGLTLAVLLIVAYLVVRVRRARRAGDGG